MGADPRWYHRGDLPRNAEHRPYWDQYYDGGTESGPPYGSKAIHYALRKIVSSVAPVMEKHGFTLAGDHQWADRAYYGGDRPTVLYRDALAWSAEMERAMGQYDDLATQYVARTYELE